MTHIQSKPKTSCLGASRSAGSFPCGAVWQRKVAKSVAVEIIEITLSGWNAKWSKSYCFFFSFCDHVLFCGFDVPAGWSWHNLSQQVVVPVLLGCLEKTVNGHGLFSHISKIPDDLVVFSWYRLVNLNLPFLFYSPTWSGCCKYSPSSSLVL
jgi:hypothetical protein